MVVMERCADCIGVRVHSNKSDHLGDRDRDKECSLIGMQMSRYQYVVLVHVRTSLQHMTCKKR